MKTLTALCFLVVSMPLAAQYGPPAKDLEEAQFFLREIQRQIEPAVTEARDRAAVFTVVARAHNRLAGKEPASEISDARRTIAEFLQYRERAGRALSPQNLRTLQSVDKELELAQPPYAIAALRERLHHEFVHPLQREVMKDMQAVERLEQGWEEFVKRQLEPAFRDGMNGISAAARDPGQ